MDRRLLVLLCGVVTTACHTMRFELAPVPTANVVTEHKNFFLDGLVPTRVVDVSEKCPYGAAAVREQTTFADGVAAAVTLGIWTPRSTTYYCLSAPPPAPTHASAPGAPAGGNP
jgi:hypothetical protein